MKQNRDRLFLLKIVTAYQNRGDLLINRSLIQNLRRYGQVRVKTTNLPAKFKQGLQLSTEEECKSHTKELLHGLGKKDIYIVGIPGHHFGTNSQLPEAIAGLIKTITFSIFLRIKFIKIGTSLGPLTKSLIQIERIKSRWYALYGVRDSVSLRLCRPSRMCLFPDLAFTSDDIPRLSFDENLSERYLLSFRISTNAIDKDEDYLNRIVDKLVVFFSRRQNAEAVIAFQVPSDQKACGVIFNALKDRTNIRVEMRDTVLELDEAIQAISESKCVFSNRLHILLPSFIMGVPHVPLIDEHRHTKITSIYDDIGASSLIHDLRSSDELTFPPDSNSQSMLGIATEQRNAASKQLSDLFA